MKKKKEIENVFEKPKKRIVIDTLPDRDTADKALEYVEKKIAKREFTTAKGKAFKALIIFLSGFLAGLIVSGGLEYLTKACS